MELLSPAGHWESMEAAVQNGAGAVYLGLEDCNARRGAKNFTSAEFPEAVRYCHLQGAKVYLTVNTLLTDRELPVAEGLLRLASASGADGVIVQDSLPESLVRPAVERESVPLAQRVRMFEQSEIHKLLLRYGSTLEGKKRTAAELGISLATLYNKLGSD